MNFKELQYFKHATKTLLFKQVSKESRSVYAKIIVRNVMVGQPQMSDYMMASRLGRQVGLDLYTELKN
ncbi:MAG: hypothetical protein GW947_00185 [Candidatus Pacebacteria bacterium]|nr:hypothetical protein [Candidatus Paceibacterota bacterium]PIR59510.1 MAG: hypothetical protein COU68_05125 [Candidatus Pacebacteria bacterium CG10_big_fil_rev_8_21_14_0_10_45_6]